MTTRFQEPAGGVAWRWPVLVRCPRCDARATVAEGRGRTIRLICPTCAFGQVWLGRALLVERRDGDVALLTRSRVSNSWLDPKTGRAYHDRLAWPTGHSEHFGAELWLARVCCGGRLLWARNAEHLEYLYSYVAGELRESPPGAAYKPLSSKLPTWLKQAKHRDEVLRHLDRMRRALD